MRGLPTGYRGERLALTKPAGGEADGWCQSDGCLCRWATLPAGGTIPVTSNEGTEMQPVHPSDHNTSSSISWRSTGLFAVRYGIGGVIVLAGVVVLAVVPGDMGAYGFASSIGAGLSVVLLNLLYRLSVSGDREREREEEARRYLDQHGVWPDDAEPHKQPFRRRWVVPRGAVLAEQEHRADRPARGERTRVPVPGER